MKEGEKMDKGGRGVPRPHTGLNYSLTLKSYTKYKIDRDRNIAHNTDKNRNKTEIPAQRAQGICTTVHETHTGWPKNGTCFVVRLTFIKY